MKFHSTFFFKKMSQLRPLFLFIFGFFKQTIQFLQQINVINVHPEYGTRIRTHDLSHELSPITTRPGLPYSEIVLSDRLEFIK